MHEGEANSGHFYSYIKDHCKDKWYKFNDHLVSEADSEDAVLNEAFGNSKPKASAYLVLYATEKVISTRLDSLEEAYERYIDDDNMEKV